MELCLIPCGSLDGRGAWGRMDTCICMAESLRCSPDTITALLTGYTPIQNKKFTKRSVGFQNLPPYLHTDGGMICSTYQCHGNSDSFPVGSSGGVKILPLLLMATHSSTLAWKIPWTEEPGRLQSMGSWRVGHDWATSLSLFTFMHWRRKWQPTPVFLPGEFQGRGSLVGCCLWGCTELDTTEVT